MLDRDYHITLNLHFSKSCFHDMIFCILNMSFFCILNNLIFSFFIYPKIKFLHNQESNKTSNLNPWQLLYFLKISKTFQSSIVI